MRKSQIFDELQVRKESSNALDFSWYNLKKCACDFKNYFLVLEISERQYLYAYKPDVFYFQSISRTTSNFEKRRQNVGLY